MKVTQVAIRSTDASDGAGRTSLTPELLAAVGARYSRSNEGLEVILGKIDRTNLDRSVDSIFRMIDYGHQSIADMAPVAIFIDGISILLAYLVWSWCPTAGGQESSTRYLRLDRDGLVDPALFGVSGDGESEWYAFIDQCFEAYASALSFWERLADADPLITQIPVGLLSDQSEKAQKQVARMKRNYAFDRARYFLPVAAKTNMMLVMSARGWVQLCQNLLSHWLPEAHVLGEHVREELGLAAPRMLKHAQLKASFEAGHAKEIQRLAALAKGSEILTGETECLPDINVFSPSDISDREIVESLSDHSTRYDFVGTAACRTSVRFSWSAVAIAEIRDLNRHRTGQKYCPLIPRGFYCGADQVPTHETFDESLPWVGDESIRRAMTLQRDANPSFAAWLLLGTQLRFEHTTTLDKFVYEAELRTGPGAHFRYASHLRDVVKLLARAHPSLAGAIRLGLNEPE